ncbi:MAG: BON domain-containing protein [Vicinamibacterales bacterium]
MLRVLIRLFLLIVVLAAAAAFFLGYRWSDWQPAQARTSPGAARPIPDRTADDARDRARAAGAAIGETVAKGVERGQEVARQGSLTAKVALKIKLDDTLKGSGIDVDTHGQTVTLNGTVLNEAQRRRALQLARETEGVTDAIDRLSVKRR